MRTAFRIALRTIAGATLLVPSAVLSQPATDRDETALDRSESAAEKETAAQIEARDAELASLPEGELDDAFQRLDREPSRYARLMASVLLGKGLRFNNPFRLGTQLGDDAESLSLTSAYVDFGVGAAFGDPDGVQHGAALRYSIGFEGVPQQAIIPTYLAVYRSDLPVLVAGRLGASVLLSPDVNPGFETGLAGAYFFSGSVGATAELVFNLFYGAGTPDVEITTYPILSFQAGIVVDYEVLP